MEFVGCGRACACAGSSARHGHGTVPTFVHRQPANVSTEHSPGTLPPSGHWTVHADWSHVAGHTCGTPEQMAVHRHSPGASPACSITHAPVVNV